MNRHPAHILLLKAARSLELLIAAVILVVIHSASLCRKRQRKSMRNEELGIRNEKP